MFFNALFGPTHNVIHHFGSLDLLNCSFLLTNFKVDKMNKRHDNNVCIYIMKCLYMFIYIYKTHLFCLCRFPLICTNININLCEESVIFCYSSFWKLCFNDISNANSFFWNVTVQLRISVFHGRWYHENHVHSLHLIIDRNQVFILFHWDHFVFTNGRLPIICRSVNVKSILFALISLVSFMFQIFRISPVIKKVIKIQPSLYFQF